MRDKFCFYEVNRSTANELQNLLNKFANANLASRWIVK